MNYREQDFEDQATICFIVEEDRMLLIEKKRGLGEGFYNGPGGKIEGGESPRQAAKREVREEVKIKVEELEKVGELKFFSDGEPFMFGHVFKTKSYLGEPEETEEARPKWFSKDSIPYDQMWPADRYWIPELLEGRKFKGCIEFGENGKELQDWNIEEAQF
jgi:8-oxo-dGTP diphosphatase